VIAPEQGPVAAERFIAIAEEVGIIHASQTECCVSL